MIDYYNMKLFLALNRLASILAVGIGLASEVIPVAAASEEDLTRRVVRKAR